MIIYYFSININTLEIEESSRKSYDEDRNGYDYVDYKFYPKSTCDEGDNYVFMESLVSIQAAKEQVLKEIVELRDKLDVSIKTMRQSNERSGFCGLLKRIFNYFTDPLWRLS